MPGEPGEPKDPDMPGEPPSLLNVGEWAGEKPLLNVGEWAGEKPGLTAEAALGLMVPTFDHAAASVGADCSRVTSCSSAVSAL